MPPILWFRCSSLVKESAGVSILAYRHLELDETKLWNFEPSSGSVLNVSCTL